MLTCTILKITLNCSEAVEIVDTLPDQSLNEETPHKGVTLAKAIFLETSNKEKECFSSEGGWDTGGYSHILYKKSKQSRYKHLWHRMMQI